MPVELSLGRIRIDESDKSTSIEVTQGNIIQLPEKINDPTYRLKISKHGNLDGTWFSITPGTIMGISPPFYVWSKYPVNIALMEV